MPLDDGSTTRPLADNLRKFVDSPVAHGADGSEVGGDQNIPWIPSRIPRV